MAEHNLERYKELLNTDCSTAHCGEEFDDLDGSKSEIECGVCHERRMLYENDKDCFDYHNNREGEPTNGRNNNFKRQEHTED